MVGGRRSGESRPDLQRLLDARPAHGLSPDRCGLGRRGEIFALETDHAQTLSWMSAG